MSFTCELLTAHLEFINCLLFPLGEMNCFKMSVVSPFVGSHLLNHDAWKMYLLQQIHLIPLSHR